MRLYGLLFDLICFERGRERERERERVVITTVPMAVCAVEGNWGSWTSWSNCSETCEAIGNQTRSRNCDNPAPANNGQYCAGNGTEIIFCDMTMVDCLCECVLVCLRVCVSVCVCGGGGWGVVCVCLVVCACLSV